MVLRYCFVFLSSYAYASLNQQTDTVDIKRLLDKSAFLIKDDLVDDKQLDSAFQIAVHAIQLSDEINFHRGRNDGTYIQGLIYIRMLKDRELKVLMNSVDSDVRAKITLEWLRYKMIFVGRKSKVDLDTLLIYGYWALNYARSISSPEITALSLTQLSSIYYELGDNVKGIEFLLKAISEQRKGKSNLCLARIFSQMGAYLVKDDTLIPVLIDIRKHLIETYPEIIGQEGHARLQADVIMGCTHIVFYFINRANYSEALFYSLSMVKLLEIEKNTFNEEMPYLTTAKIYLELDKFDECLEYCTKTVSIGRRKGAMIQPLVIKMATRAFVSLRRPEDGIDFINEHSGAPNSYLDYMISESLGECYLAMKKYKKAEVCYLKCLEIAEGDSRSNRLIANFGLGKLYTAIHEYDKARKYLDVLVSQSNGSYVPLSIQRDVHFMLYQADSARGKLGAALYHFKAFKAFNDSSYNEKQTSRIETLKMQYETEKKDYAIQFLTQKSALQQADLRQSRILRNASIVGATALLIVLSLGYSKYKLKQTTNLLLQLSQAEITNNNRTLQLINGQLQKLVAEKEWLVKEIHHRVKNNLQVIVSLLNTQASYLSEGDALSAIRESQLRMQVISLLHQRLSQFDNSRSVSMKMYLTELVGYIAESYKGFGKAIIEFNLDPIQLDISQAVSVGLILNEAITNSMKYAFNKNDQGRIKVSLVTRENEKVILSIADNGRGLPVDFFTKKRDSLGMRLMETLSEQIEGALTIADHQGVIVSVCFSKIETYDDTVDEVGIDHLANPQ